MSEVVVREETLECGCFIRYPLLGDVETVMIQPCSPACPNFKAVLADAQARMQAMEES